MCLIVLSFQQHSDFPLIVAANRDEFYARPAAPLAWWADNPDILAGRDLSPAGGTWLGINRSGRFAAVTNYREPGNSDKSAKSRGILVKDFLSDEISPEDYAIQLQQTAAQFNGYNLLFGNRDEMWYFSNRSNAAAKRMLPGLYGLSNHLLDTPWFKVRRAKEKFDEIGHSADAIFGLMADDTQAPAGDIQQTGMPAEIEKMLSPIFIRSETYGTRVTSYVRFAATGEVEFLERPHVPVGVDRKVQTPTRAI